MRTLDANKISDPVCGAEVDVSTPYHSHYLGETYYFCSAEDKAKFDENPVAYFDPAETPRDETRDEEYE